MTVTEILDRIRRNDATTRHAGSIVFIPKNAWLSLKNIGKSSIAQLASFNAPR